MSTSSSDDSGRAPLQGVRVLDFTRILAGPWCTMQLGDMGADVIKVEVPGKGDDTRSWGPPFIGSESAYFLCCNRNKRSIAVDIKSAEGRGIIHDLVRQSDVFVENYLPGKLDAMGYGYDTLSRINPRLVYASISGYGATGPSAHRAGYDVALSAQGGLMSITGPEGGAPVKVGVAVTDISTGLYMHGAILAALFARQRTGMGARLDTSLLEVQIATLANIASNVLVAGKEPRRWGTSHESIVPYGGFPASDGDVIIAVMSDAQYRTFCRVIGAPHLATDERYATNAGRVAHRAELVAALSAIIRAAPRAHWIGLLTDAGITAAPINSVREALDDPQVRHRDMVVNVHHAALGRDIAMTGLPVKYAGGCGSASIRLPPPLLGQHTYDVLQSLLSLPDTLATPQQKTKWRAILNAVPPLPVTEKQNKKVLTFYESAPDPK
ncbi:CoA transferase, partial [archaeon]